jgi:uncharacterized membrane protein YhhN
MIALTVLYFFPLEIGWKLCFPVALLFMAMLQRSSLYTLGAALFVISDLILAWNLFVEPISHAGAMIMTTYYFAQWLIFIRATPYKVPHPVKLMRF